MLVYSRRDLSKIENSIRQIFTHQRTNVPKYIRYFHENVRITQKVAHENVDFIWGQSECLHNDRIMIKYG